GAVIQNALIGINTTDNTTIGFYNYDFGGGIITMDNSFIKECEKGIKLAPYGWQSIYGNGPDEQSSITNSFIENCVIGIFAERNIGLDVTYTEFNHNSDDIESYVSSFNLTSNTFNNGVYMYSIYPNIYGSLVNDNHIYNEDFVVLSQGNFSPFVFDNNRMYSGSGLWIEGDLDFEVTHNDFLGSIFGIFTYFSGDNMYNVIQDNLFSGTEWGNIVLGENDTEYLTNCFENTAQVDMEVHGSASIFEIQGNEEDSESAGNCFDAKIQTASNSVSFEYWTKDGFENTTSCKFPGSGNFIVVRADFELANDDCGSGLVAPNIPTASVRDCNCDPSKNNCKGIIASIQATIDALLNNSTIDIWVKTKELAKLRRCLDKLIKVHVRDLIGRGNGEDAINFLSVQTDLRYKAMAYAIIMDQMEYDKARQFLNNFVTFTREEIDFVNTQNIFLDYLADRENYTLSKSNRSMLYAAGKRDNPTSGYSKSLYYKLTGDRILVNFTHLDGSDSKTREIKEIDKITIYPNPISDEYINVSIDKLESESIYTVSVYNTMGKMVITQRIADVDTRLDIGHTKGLYIISLNKDGKTIKTEKIVKY
ncbi:MAG: T9SS type A sorting domain-containing protein, partial [Saprospiraceae bacterium]